MRFSSTQKDIKRIDMTYQNIKKYKMNPGSLKGLCNMRTGLDYRGYIYIDKNDTVVAYVNMRKSDNYITAIAIDKKYQERGWGSELLQDLVDMGVDKLSINKDNIIIKKLCDDLFNVRNEDGDIIYMTLKESFVKHKPLVLTEAPNNTDEELSATDYGDMEDVEVDNNTDEDLTADDTNEDAIDETDDTTTDENPEEPEPVEGEETDLENTDDGAENDSGENINEEQPNNDSVEQSQEDNAKNKYLINDFIELYNRLEEIIEKISGSAKLNKIRDPRCIQAKFNMEKMKDVLYDYITTRFEQESYVFNLYQFNLIIQAINVNIDLLTNAFKKPLEKKNNK